MSHVPCSQLLEQPLPTVQDLYQDMGLALDDSERQAIQHYLAQKPRGKFGKHRYRGSDAQERSRKRELFKRYQHYFWVPDET